MKLFVAFLFVATILMSCKSANSNNCAPEVARYLNEVLDLLKRESVNKHKIDWNEFDAEVFRYANNCKTVVDAYPAINYAIAKLGDKHSYFVSAIEDGGTEKPLPTLNNEIAPKGIGYLRLPFCIGDEQQVEQYITSIYDKAALQNTPQVKGWIIDLRDNFGGNMWPMIAAVSFFLDNGIQGYFVDGDNKAESWRLEGSKVLADTTVLAEQKHALDVYKKDRIAVLINGQTASSGEAMAVLFKGYANVKLFGTPTFGVSTGCRSFSLSDGSRINLAISVFADRNRIEYGGAIAPDVVCEENETLSTAINWIYN